MCRLTLLLLVVCVFILYLQQVNKRLCIYTHLNLFKILRCVGMQLQRTLSLRSWGVWKELAVEKI